MTAFLLRKLAGLLPASMLDFAAQRRAVDIALDTTISYHEMRLARDPQYRAEFE